MRKHCIQVDAPIKINDPGSGAQIGTASAYQICQDERGNFTVEAVGEIRWYVETNGTIGVRRATGEEIGLWRQGGIPAENPHSDPLQWDGSFVERYRDYEAPGFSPGLGYRFERVYNSRRSAVRSALGFGWSLHYDQYIQEQGGCQDRITIVLDGSPVVFLREEGEPSRSWWSGADPALVVLGYRNAQSPTYRLERVQDAADRPGEQPQQREYWLVDVETGTRSVFRSHHEHLPERTRTGEDQNERIEAKDFASHPVLNRIEDAAGNALRFTWEPVPIDGDYRILGVRLASIEDTRHVVFRYVYVGERDWFAGSPEQRLQCVSLGADCRQALVRMEYSPEGDLLRAVQADGRGFSYRYTPDDVREDEREIVPNVPSGLAEVSAADLACARACGLPSPSPEGCWTPGASSPCQSQADTCDAILRDASARACRRYCRSTWRGRPLQCADACPAGEIPDLGTYTLSYPEHFPAQTYAPHTDPQYRRWMFFQCQIEAAERVPYCNGVACQVACTYSPGPDGYSGYNSHGIDILTCAPQAGLPVDEAGRTCPMGAALEGQQNGCLTQCRNYLTTGSITATESVSVYGAPIERTHNLIEVYDPFGRLQLRQRYEADIHSPSFDRVISQELPIGPPGRGQIQQVQVTYYDLRVGLQDPRVPAFADVEICPATESEPWWSMGPVQAGADVARFAVVTTTAYAETVVSFLDGEQRLLRQEWRTLQGGTWQTVKAEACDYDAAGMVRGHVDASGRRQCMVRDARGLLRGTVELGSDRTAWPAVPRVEERVYDDWGRLAIARMDVAGSPSVVSFERDELGRVVREQRTAADVAPRETEYAYEATEFPPGVGPILPTRATDRLTGAETRFLRYDGYGAEPATVQVVEQGRVLSDVSRRFDVHGRETFRAEWSSGNGPGRNATRIERDAVGRVVAVYRQLRAGQPEVQVLRAGIDVAGGEVVEWSEAFGSADAADAGMREVKALDPQHHVYRVAREEILRSGAAIPGSAHRIGCFDIGFDGRERAALDAEGALTEIAYDAAGRVRSVVRGSGMLAADEAWVTSDCVLSTDGGTFQVLQQFAYDPATGLVATREEAGLRWDYTYDGLGRVAETTDELGRVMRQGYDGNGRVLWQALYQARPAHPSAPSLGDPGLVRWSERAYDGWGRVTQELQWHLESGQPKVVTTTYDDVHRQQSITADGRTIRVRQDAVGREVERVSPDGTMATTTFEGFEQRATTCEDMSTGRRCVRLEQDEAGRVIHAIAASPDGLHERYRREYDLAGRLRVETKAGLGPERTGYNGFGELIRSERQTSAATWRQEAACGAGGCLVWPSCADWSFGRGPDVSRSETTVYTVGRRGGYHADTDAEQIREPGTEEYEYDDETAERRCGEFLNGLLSDLRDATAEAYRGEIRGTKQWRYSRGGPRNAQVQCTVALQYPTPATGSGSVCGACAESTYPACATATRARSVRVAFDYDRVGRLRFVRQANDTGDAVTETRYDALGRVVMRIDPLGRSESTAYVAGSTRPAMIQDSAGIVRQYAYDDAGRLVAEVTTTSERWTQFRYVYNAADEITAANVERPWARVASITTRRAYDSLGRLTHEHSSTLPVGAEDWRSSPFTVRRSYDLNGQWSQVGLADVTLTYALDGMGRLAAVTHKQADNAREVVRFGYGASGRGPALRAVFGDATEDTRIYDGLGRQVGLDVRQQNAASEPQRIALRRDALAAHDMALWRRTAFANEPAPLDDVFGLDEAGHLVDEALDLPGVMEWPSGEIAPRSVDAALRANARMWRHYDVDGAHNWRRVDVGGAGGWRMGGTLTVDSGHRYAVVALQSRLGTASPTAAAYDLAHNAMAVPAVDAVADTGLQAAYDDEGHPVHLAAGGRSLDLVYDAFGRRVLEVDERGEPTYLVWDGDEVLALGHRAVEPNDVFSYRLRVSGASTDETLAVADALGRGASWWRYVHQWSDSGDTLAVTDNHGLVEGYRYDGWGRPRLAGGGMLVGCDWNRFLWRGALYDGATGTYAMRAREYAPQWGRFLSPDPIGQAGGFNVFAFADGRPDGRDPSGLSAFQAWAGGVTSVSLPPSTPPEDTNQGWARFGRGVKNGFRDRVLGLRRLDEALRRDPSGTIREIPGAIARDLWNEFNAGNGSFLQAALAEIGCAVGSAADCRQRNPEVLGQAVGGAVFDVLLARATAAAGRLGKGANPPGHLGAAESSLSIAQQGGKHSGFLRQAESWTPIQRDRASRNLQKQLEFHEAKLDNPANFVKDWERMSPDQQQGLLRHWEKEIGNFAEQQSILQGL